MISDLSTRDLVKLRRRLNAFVWGLNAKMNAFGRPGLPLAVSARRSFRVVPPPWATFSTRASIFFGSPWRTICSSVDFDVMSANRHRFLTSSGMAASDSDSVIDTDGLTVAEVVNLLLPIVDQHLAAVSRPV